MDDRPRHEARPGSPDADAVLETARQLLTDHGPSALSVRRLADELGVSRQVVYSRFGSMRGLLGALYADGFRRLSDAVQSVPEIGTDAHLLGVGRAYRAHARQAPAIYRLMFDGDPGFTPDTAARAASDRAFTVICGAAAAWLDLPDPRDPLARTLAGALWASAHGVVSLERAGHLNEDVAARQLDEVVIRILAGSRPPRTNDHTEASSGGVTPR